MSAETETPDAPLRVLMLSQRFPPDDYTGAPLQAWHLSKALVRMGVSVGVLSTRALPTGRPEGRGDGLQVDYLPYLDWPGCASASRFITAGAAVPRLRSWDVLHGHALSPMVLGAALRGGTARPPMLVKPSIGGEHEEGEISRVRRSPAAPLLRRAMLKIDSFAVLDALIDRDLRDAGVASERLHPVDNGVDLSYFAPVEAERKLRLREKHGIASQSLLLFCGQLSPRKGLLELLEAWQSEAMQSRDAVLVICGDGPLRSSVLQADRSSAGRVRYLGRLSDTAEVMQMSDLLVLPSRFESFGNVIVEALACGLPVVATRSGIGARAVIPGISGWRIAEVSTQAVSASLKQAFESRQHWGAMADDCVRQAQNFSIDAIARQYLQIYHRMLRQRAESAQAADRS